jgi:hypothetical protein
VDEEIKILEVGQIEELLPGTEGIYTVETETASYIINLDNSTAARFPKDSDALNPHPQYDSSKLRVHALRRDREVVKLLAFTIVLGEPMVLTLQSVSDDPEISTVRQTTLVRSIRKIDLSEDPK